MSEINADSSSNPSRLDGHRLSEFVYGTVTGLVAIAGTNSGEETNWLHVTAVVVSGAMAIWTAHAYSILISKRVVAGHRLDVRDLAETLLGSWPIVIAGVILALPLLPVGLNLWSLSMGLLLSKSVGISILSLVGFLAGVVERETWLRRFVLAAMSAGLGLAVVAIEFVFHH